MKMLKRGLAALLVLTFLALNLPNGAFCEDSLPFSKAAKKNITRHEPKIMTTPAKVIPMVRAEEKEQKSKSRYLWYGLGAAVVLGVVAAGAGGGGGGGGGDTPGEETGNIAVGW
jgi:hypothetical protein